MRRHRDPPLVAAARAAGVRDARVLRAMAAVPRARFVPEMALAAADRDRPIAIGAGQTTSQPSLIAAMLAALELTGRERVLEVGTGYGYQTALLTHLAAEVYSIERIERLARRAREHLAAIGAEGALVVVGDGTLGLPAHAPYDAVVVSAAADDLPPALAGQVVEGGRLVAPVGRPGAQEVWLFRTSQGRAVRERRLSAVRFVPLVAGDPVEDR